MAEITRFFWWRHLRGEASSTVIAFRRGRRWREGRGVSFWFVAARTSIMEIPADDRDTDFVFATRSRDYQAVTVQGTITWRAAAPEALADRVDFTIDLRTGRLRNDPMERIASLLIGLAQYQSARYVEHRDIHALLAEGAAPLQDTIAAGIASDPRLRDMGLAVVTVRLAGMGRVPNWRGHWRRRPSSAPRAWPTRRPSPGARWPSRRSARSPRTSLPRGSSWRAASPP